MKNNNDNILIEIGTEELPYKNLYEISTDFKSVIKNNAKKLNINFNSIKNFITARRISFIIELCSKYTETIIEEKIKELMDITIIDENFKIKMRWEEHTKFFI